MRSESVKVIKGIATNCSQTVKESKEYSSERAIAHDSGQATKKCLPTPNLGIGNLVPVWISKQSTKEDLASSRATSPMNLFKEKKFIPAIQHGSKIDWCRPVYFSFEGKLFRNVKQISIFTLNNVKNLLNIQATGLAEAFVHQIKKRSGLPSPKFDDIICAIQSDAGVQRPENPSTHCALRTCSSLSTPTLTIRSVSSDTDLAKMRTEIEDIVTRTPGLGDPPKGRSDLIDLAARAIEDLQSVHVRKNENANSGKRNAPELDNIDKASLGSSYFYTLVTPTKRVKEILQTESTASLVRRSNRIIARGFPSQHKLFQDLDEIEDLSEVGFLPSPSVGISPSKNKDSSSRKQGDYNK